eukprot:3131949-Pyramimonas_sp.AAC.1
MNHLSGPGPQALGLDTASLHLITLERIRFWLDLTDKTPLTHLIHPLDPSQAERHAFNDYYRKECDRLVQLEKERVDQWRPDSTDALDAADAAGDGEPHHEDCPRQSSLPHRSGWMDSDEEDWDEVMKPSLAHLNTEIYILFAATLKIEAGLK